MAKSQYSPRYRRLLKSLRQAREGAGMTQLEAAKTIHKKHPSFISKVESGERRIDVIELADLCHLYEISLTDFLKSAGIE
jgi:transcriptional regulator with XRE-family HTH domain